MDHAIVKGDACLNYDEQIDAGHGRIEIRRCWASDSLEWLKQKSLWRGLRSICAVESERIVDGKSSIERRYYISSLAAEAGKLSASIRQHWGIENKLHWVLDVVFREDENRVRVGHAPENMAVLRHMALNLLKQETSLKRGIKAKRLKAGWDMAYLIKILGTVNMS